MKTIKHPISILLILILLWGSMLFLIGCTDSQESNMITIEPNTHIIEPTASTNEPDFVLEDTLAEINLIAVGDIMAHMPQIKAQYISEEEGYRFDNNYVFIKPYLINSDLALCNLETTLAGRDKAYSGYPRFNAPDELVDALVYAGFDVLSTANNHSYDTGGEGLLRTLDIINERGLLSIGTRNSIDRLPYENITVNGINLGITAYTYETNADPNLKALNGIPLKASFTELVDTFHFSTIDEDLKNMVNRVTQMRAEGAECIIFYMHWGDEYTAQPNEMQVKIAKALCEAGVDIVFGSHPHVVQRVDFIENEKGDHETLVVYSMGNFISNQRASYTNDPHTEDGLMVSVTLERGSPTDKVTITQVSLYPTWVNRHSPAGKRLYEIVPLNEALKSPEIYNLLTTEQQKNAQGSYERTLERIGDLELRMNLP